MSKGDSDDYAAADKHKYLKVTFDETKLFMVDCLKSAGASPDNAKVHSDCLFDADYKGFVSHGMNRLAWYCRSLRTGKINAKDAPAVCKETCSSAYVDGKNVLGTVVGVFCMGLAMAKAKKTGFGAVCCKNSSHFGICAFYTLRATDAGLIGFSCTNTTPLVSPPRAKGKCLGTNPLAFGAPIEEKKKFLIDMASSVTAMGHLEILRKANLPIPDGFIRIPPEGADNVPVRSLELLHLGSSEVFGDHKGFGLSLMVEILSAVLSGSNVGPQVPILSKLKDGEHPNIGHFFFCIDPKVFTTTFQEKLHCLNEYIHALEPIDKNKPVGIPGDRENRNVIIKEKTKVLEYSSVEIDICNTLAKEFKVAPIVTCT